LKQAPTLLDELSMLEPVHLRRRSLFVRCRRRRARALPRVRC
jgi:hypothetical protein